MALAHQKTGAVAATAQIDAADRAPRIFQGVDNHSLSADRGYRMNYHDSEQNCQEEAYELLPQRVRGHV
jgi:hypothetical protein